MRQLNEEHRLLLNNEDNARVFLAATGEDIESLRPEYDYGAVQQELARIEEKIRKVKHAVNVFNSTTTVEGMTIDEILVFLPQAAERLQMLAVMLSKPPKFRATDTGRTSIIEYEYLNYDLQMVRMGQLLTVVGETMDWYQAVDSATGRLGWVSKAYVYRV